MKILFTLAILVIVTQAKPLQEDNELKEPGNSLEVSKADQKTEKNERINRQIRIRIDPDEDDENNDYEPIEDDRQSKQRANQSSKQSRPKEVNIGGGRRPQSLQYPQSGSGSGIGSLISSVLGSSSGGRNRSLMAVADDERISRIRRQVEQVTGSRWLRTTGAQELVSGIQKNMNGTKLAKQIDDDDSLEEPSSNDLPSDDNESASSEEDEPPGGGDGQGGGILGILAGLSGEGGQSDLGTLLATVGSIVANLSGGEGFDLNTLIGSAVALLGGILAGDGMKNIGAQIGGYLVTALEGITGGGATNNGAFFGNLAATLIAGTSAAGNGGSSEEGGGGSDSGSFFISLISSILGGSSGRK